MILYFILCNNHFSTIINRRTKWTKNNNKTNKYSIYIRPSNVTNIQRTFFCVAYFFDSFISFINLYEPLLSKYILLRDVLPYSASTQTLRSSNYSYNTLIVTRLACCKPTVIYIFEKYLIFLSAVMFAIFIYFIVLSYFNDVIGILDDISIDEQFLPAVSFVLLCLFSGIINNSKLFNRIQLCLDNLEILYSTWMRWMGSRNVCVIIILILRLNSMNRFVKHTGLPVYCCQR